MPPPLSGRKRKLVDCASVGEPPQTLFEEVETVKFVIHGFKDREEKRGQRIMSPILKAHGYQWKINVHPRGHRKSSSSSNSNSNSNSNSSSFSFIEYLSCYLEYVEYVVGENNNNNNKKNENTETETEPKPGPATQFIVRCKRFKKKSHLRKYSNGKSCRGWPNYLKREDVLTDYLEEDGSLVIEVDIRIAAESKLAWYPKKLHQQEILVELYHDAAETSDIVFNVEGKEYYAHKNILSRRAKTLFELGKQQYNNNNNNNNKDEDEDEQQQPIMIPISGIKGETFQKLLEFVYTVRTPEMEDDIATAKEILLAADRFDCTQLKLYAESIIVDKFLVASNAAALLVFADSYSCALLKEAAMNLYATDPSAVMESDEEGWSRIKESLRLVTELLENSSLKFVSKRNSEPYKKNKKANNNVAEVDDLDVTSIREELQEAKLEVDGSREILVERLKKHQQEK